MTTVEVAYASSGMFVVLSGICMMLVYSFAYPWWRSHTGRMLITYAVAETGMSAIFASAVVFRTDPTWFRYTWVILQSTVGLVLCYQTFMILKLKRNRGDLDEVGETD